MRDNTKRMQFTTTPKQRISVRTMTIAAVLSTIAALLMILDFAVPIFPSFVKLDFSDLPALVGAFTLGPIAGVGIEAIKNLLKLLFSGTSTGGIGELANFIIGTALVFPAGLVYKYNKTRKGAVAGMILGTTCMTVIGALANYFILIPFYENFMPLDAIIAMCSLIIPAIDSLEKVILFSIIPFNLFKGTVVSLITFLIYKRLSPILKG